MIKIRSSAPIFAIASHSKTLLLLIVLYGLLFASAGSVDAATYYVDSAITDTNVGSATPDCTNYDPNAFTCSGGSASAYKTVADINAGSFSPDDQILFRKGQTWREQLTVPSSGTSGHPITFGAFGSGAQPVINGADTVTGWTNVSGTVYHELSATVPNQVFSDGVRLSKNSGAGASLGSNEWDFGSYGPSWLFNGNLDNEVTAFTQQFTGKTVSGTNTLTPSTTSGEFNFGAQGAKVTYDGTEESAYAIKTFQSTSEAYIRVYIKLNNTYALGSTFRRLNYIELWDSGHAKRLARFGIQSNNPATTQHYSAAFFNGTADASLINTGNLATSTWIRLELHWKAGTGADGGAEVKVDGTSLGNSFASDLTAYTADTLYIGSIQDQSDANPSASSELYFDDVAVSTTSYPGTTDGTGGGDGLFVNTGNDPNTHTILKSVRDIGVLVQDKNYITVDGLQLDKQAYYGAFVTGTAVGSSDFTIRNSTVTDCYDRGIHGWDQTYPNDNVLIENNEIYGCGAFGITWTKFGTGGLISGNDVHDNALLTEADTGDSEFIYTAGIDIFGNQVGISNIVIEKNKVYNNGRAGQLDSNGAGIWNDETIGGNIIRYNMVYDNAGNGIIAENTPSGGDIYGNLVYNNGNGVSGGAFGIFLSRGVQNWNVFNNTLYGNYKGLVAADYAGGFTQTNNVVRNNLVAGSVSTAFVARGSGESSSNFYNHNTFGPESSSFIEWGAGVYKSTYSAWETAYGTTTNSVQSNPLFTNTGGGNFTLQSSSPAIDNGANLGSPYNLGLSPAASWPNSVATLDQDSYGTGWEIGAYVYPSAPSAASTPSPTNASTTVALTASLSFTAGSGATSHGIYFGTNPTLGTSEYKNTQAGTSYAPGTLSAGTTYYWRIDEANTAGTTTGTVWSFTTVGAADPASSLGGGGALLNPGGSSSGNKTKSNTDTPAVASTTATSGPSSTTCTFLEGDTAGDVSLAALIKILFTTGIIPADKQTQACEALQNLATTTDAQTTAEKDGLFTAPLEKGDRSEEVRQLQQFLNTHGFVLATTGLGARGNETDFFGILTFEAVKRFQATYAPEILTPVGLTAPTGYWGQSSIRQANALLGL